MECYLARKRNTVLSHMATMVSLNSDAGKGCTGQAGKPLGREHRARPQETVEQLAMGKGLPFGAMGCSATKLRW